MWQERYEEVGGLPGLVEVLCPADGTCELPRVPFKYLGSWQDDVPLDQPDHGRSRHSCRPHGL